LGLLLAPGHARDVVAQSRILDALKFEDMYGRYETVDQAHLKTMRWIFSERTDGGDKIRRFNDEYSDDEEDHPSK
jgi:hypothetical protein